MAANFEDWKKVLGHQIDLDNQSFDCVDVPKHWAEFGTGKPWQNSLCWGNAKDIWANAPDAYWERIPRGQGQPGDIMCCDGSIGGGYGHVAVVVERNGGNITVYQQNTFTQQPVYTGIYGVDRSYIQGFLRPKFPVNYGSAPALAGNQRVAAYAAKYRQAPNSNAELIKLFTAGETYDFKGFVHAENVDGNDVWFVGAYTGGYVWSGAFTDTSTHDLPDITPAPAIKATQRQIGADAMNYRSSAKVSPDNVIRVLAGGSTVDFSGWVHGQAVDGNDIWFATGEGFVWSGGFADGGTHDLTDLNGVNPAPTPTPPVVYPAPTNDALVTKVYNKKHMVGEYVPGDLVAVGNGQTLRSEAATALSLMQKQSGSSLSPASGYRSYAVQQTLYDNYVKQDGKDAADRYSARAGYSEHQTGLTMDFAPIDDAFKIGAGYKFLTENGYKFGWILRYPADKETVTGYMSEPWHWRYVGVDLATDMHNKGIRTLEEYFNVAGGGYEDDKPTPIPTPAPTPDPNKPGDLRTSVIRTVVPYIVGLLVALLGKYHIVPSPEFLDQFTGIITLLVGSGYYVVARWLEGVNPQFGLLLGSTKKPEYSNNKEEN